MYSSQLNCLIIQGNNITDYQTNHKILGNAIAQLEIDTDIIINNQT